MARPEVTGRKPEGYTEAFSVREFCARHGISVALYYKMQPLGMMPATFNIGSRVLISREAAAAWRREREAASQASHVA